MTLPEGWSLAPSPDLLSAQEWQESGGDPNAVSPKGAFTVAQIMPNTARDPGLGVTPLDFNATDRTAEARRFQKDYMTDLLTHYGGDEEKALAAYNFGIGNVDKGRQYPTETRNYISAIQGRKAQMKP